jgi:hypothetical protein
MPLPEIRWLVLLILSFVPARAALIINGAQPITERVTVQPIVVSNTNGTNTATFLGTLAQQAAIYALVDQIWAQAGIDVEWLSANSYNSTFANTGTASPRPTSDLGQIVNQGNAAGAGNSNPTVIDMYFVQVVPGFMQLASNVTAGLAFVGGNGIAMWIGSDLLTAPFNPPGNPSGLEAIASVLAHEIGHNLGLNHLVEAFNLMQEGGDPNQGDRLNAMQISIAIASGLSVPTSGGEIPEPSTLSLLGIALALLLLGGGRRKSRSL